MTLRDLAAQFVTRRDLAQFVTCRDLARFVTCRDLARFVTRRDPLVGPRGFQAPVVCAGVFSLAFYPLCFWPR